MKRALATLVFVVFSASYAGCIFQHMSPERQLTDQAYAYNDEIRWSRIDLAAQRVHSDYRGTFLASHAEWGSEIMIADADMTNVSFEDGQGAATTLVRFAWYDQRTMEVTGTIVAQHWTMTDNGFQLDGEEIVSGEGRLLILPEEDEEEGEETPEVQSAGGAEVLAQR